MTKRKQSQKSKKKQTWRKRFTKYKKKQPFKAWLLLIGGSGVLAFGTFLIGLTLLVRIGAFGALPSSKELLSIKNDNASIIYSEDEAIIGKYYVQNRTSVAYNAISPHVINALVSTEDARFFEHQGIDFRAWARVFVKTILMHDQSSGGGSTLSQQLSKNLYPRQNYWFLSIPVAKIKEMFIAKRLENVYDKDQLLNLYLNTVPFGANVFGVQAASKTFFNKNAKNLKIEEAAVLVGMLKANTRFNPVRNPKWSKARRNVVLKQMSKYGHLKPSQVDELKKLPLKVDYQRQSQNDGLATYFREHLRGELDLILEDITDEHGEEVNLYRDGLKIYTTINSDLQSYAEQAVSEQMTELQKAFDQHWKGKKAYKSEKNIQAVLLRSDRYKRMKAAGKSKEAIKESFEKAVRMNIFTHQGDKLVEMTPLDSIKYYYCLLNAGFLAAEPKTGKVLAWVGGIDQQFFKYDHVKSRRQTGSVFKPFVYATAIEQGIEPCEYVENKLVTYADYDNWQPHNSDGEYGGVYSLQGGLRNSVNAVAVNLIMRAGIENVVQTAERLGIDNDIPAVPAIALGVAELSLQEMVQAYSSFANRGIRKDMYMIDRIETAKGDVIYLKEKPDAMRVMDEMDADLMNELMQGVVDSGTARRLRFKYKLPGEIAGKTGTTQSQADGWFMGFNPNMVAGVWVGAEYPVVSFRSLSLGQGANTALPIFGRFMQKVWKNSKTKKYAAGHFEPLSPEAFARLDCLPYLDEAPPEVDSTALESDDFYQVLDGIFDRFRDKKNGADERVNKAPGKTRAEIQAQHRAEQVRKRAKIEERNAKLKRKKKRKKRRKKFFDGIFGN